MRPSNSAADEEPRHDRARRQTVQAYEVEVGAVAVEIGGASARKTISRLRKAESGQIVDICGARSKRASSVVAVCGVGGGVCSEGGG